MTIAGIVAGGTGSRMGNAPLPKQFYEIGSQTVITYTVGRFLAYSGIDAVIIGINPAFRKTMEKLAEKYLPREAAYYITDGGADRNATIERIIAFAEKHLGCGDEDIILTHDAVRPFVTSRMIADSIAAMADCEICTAAIASTDTIAVSQNGNLAEVFPDRSTIYRIQTPQTFRIGSFKAVFSSLTPSEKASATDVCTLFRSHGKPVRLIRGDEQNIKLTYPFDYELAKKIAAADESCRATDTEPKKGADSALE